MALTPEDEELLEQIKRQDDLDAASTIDWLMIALRTGAAEIGSLHQRIVEVCPRVSIRSPQEVRSEPQISGLE
jgi:hypothetical protein